MRIEKCKWCGICNQSSLIKKAWDSRLRAPTCQKCVYTSDQALVICRVGSMPSALDIGLLCSALYKSSYCRMTDSVWAYVVLSSNTTRICQAGYEVGFISLMPLWHNNTVPQMHSPTFCPYTQGSSSKPEFGIVLLSSTQLPTVQKGGFCNSWVMLMSQG